MVASTLAPLLATSLAVGGCWQGSDRKMRHQLRGYLAGLSVLVGRREHSEVLKCLVQCSESLQLPATNLLEPGMEMVTNSHGSQVTIDGDNVDNMNQLVRQVAYLNTREFPASGKRKLELETTMVCSDGSRRKVPTTVSTILVMTAPQAIITISGTENTSKEYQEFKAGVRMFAEVKISESQEGSGSPREEIDKCSITVFPPLNPDHEEINLPHFMMKTLKLEGKVTEAGAEISGTDMVYNYEQILRQITYSNMKPAYYLNRQFKLICSLGDVRATSNEYVQTLAVIHPDPEVGLKTDRVVAVVPGLRQRSDHSVQVRSGPQVSMGANSSQQGHLLLALVLLAVSLLVAVLVVGLVKFRANTGRHSRSEEQEVEMAWDDAALNITVNPLEDASAGARVNRGAPKMMESDLYQDSSDEEMYEESSDDDEEEEEDSEHRHRLEWDEGL